MEAIETRGLTKYYGKSRGVIDLNLTVAEGEVFGFIGPNGAGKSTTIKTLLNFIRPTSGKASIFGHDCVSDPLAVKRLVGYVPAEVNYYEDMTARELLAYSAEFSGRDCGARSRELADLFEVELDKRIENLSTGNRRKIALVQALQHAPQLLILDEPTTGLDPLMQARFFEALATEHQRGATIFLSSHILSEVQRICGRVGIIKEGRLIRVETIEKLRGSQYKRVKLEFGADEAARAFNLAGVQSPVITGRTVEFLYRGQVPALLQTAAALNLTNCWLEEPSLEEVFMHYYEKEAN